jgi:hypothetical protein
VVNIHVLHTHTFCVCIFENTSPSTRASARASNLIFENIYAFNHFIIFLSPTHIDIFHISECDTL